MDATQALSELTALSAQITSAVVLDEQGSPSASTLDDARTADLAESVKALVDAAARAADRDGGLAQLEVATPAGSVFVGPRRQANDRGDHEARAGRGARLLRPEDDAARARRPAEASPQAA